jgi:NADH:ubiquinone oxidoreductase subunit 6 (subunit J)
MTSLLQNHPLISMITTLIIVMVCTAFAQWVVRRDRLVFWFRSDEAVDTYISILTVFFGLLLGLVAVDLWNTREEAEKNTTNEANQIRILADLTASLPGSNTVLITALGDYAQGVIKKEWPMMLSKQQREMFVASPELDNVRHAIMDLEPGTVAELAAFEDILGRFGQIVEARQRRILDSERELPAVLRLTLIIGALFMLFCTFFIESKHLHTQSMLAAVAGGYLFLIIYTILILEHPFVGQSAVSFTPYERVLEVLH